MIRSAHPDDSASRWLTRVDEAWRALRPARRSVAAWTLLAIGTLPVLSRLFIGGASADVETYRRGAEALVQGARVYGEVAFEYPVYALLWCLAPYAVSHDPGTFLIAFGLEMWFLDAAIKAALLWHGVRARQGLRDLAPFVVYSLGSAALGPLLLRRYDLAPAAISFAAVLATAAGWPLTSGALVAFGAGTKVYPIVLLPVLAAIEWRRGRLGRFVVGAALATIPALLAAAWIPWWRFAAFHADRGLQVESLPASLIWALHFAGVPATWARVKTAHEVLGPMAAAVLTPARLLWGAVSLAAVGAATLTAVRLGGRRDPTGAAVSLPHVATLALLPITAFVASNVVLSPQFMLWLLPLAALVLFAPPGASAGPTTLPAPARRAARCIFVATLLVPAFYPSREYIDGLGLWRTAVLLLRNGLLIYATGCLWIAVRTMRRAQGG